jgi:hypothetical protein
MDDRKEIDEWTDTAAHNEWLNVRHQARNTGFSIPEQVRDDAVARLHQIITKTLGKDTITVQDEMAIKAVLALAKLSSTTTSAVSVQAAALQGHVRATGPRDTTEQGKFIESLTRNFGARD